MTGVILLGRSGAVHAAEADGDGWRLVCDDQDRPVAGTAAMTSGLPPSCRRCVSRLRRAAA